MKRREAREIVFCLIFEKDFNKDVSCKELYNTALSYFDNSDIENEPYIFSTFNGVFENIDDIDSIISDSSANWESDRISRVSKAILRLAVYEVKYAADIPSKIAANEAVELAKKFDEDKAFSFINGVLAKVITDHGTDND